MSKLAKTLQAAAGNAGGGEYVEDVFSTYLYTGNGSTQTINNGIDLDGEGGLVWIKARNVAIQPILVDTTMPKNVRYAALSSDRTSALGADESDMTSFNSNGFTLQNYQGTTNGNTNTHASWTFRKAPKFFDVVTWTGDGVAGREIAHSLESAPGMVFVKRTDTTGDWLVGVPTAGGGGYTQLTLNTTSAGASRSYDSSGLFSSVPTATNITINNYGYMNASGGTYVAYLFAHDAGGFGDDGEQNVISCGSVVLNGSGNATVNLGYEPQWIMVKRSDNTSNWDIYDTMRGLNLTTWTTLRANLSSAEATQTATYITPSSTGFNLNAYTSGGASLIYMAIRRPMKAPEAGTEVFMPVTRNSTVGGVNYYTGFPVDFSIYNVRTGPGMYAHARLSAGGRLQTVNTNAEIAGNVANFSSNVGYQPGTASTISTALTWNFKRAPGFFDVVCDTGTGSPKTEAHNLGVVPELIIRKSRSNAGPYWLVGSTYLTFSNDEYLQLSTTGATQVGGGSYWNGTAPTSSVFSVGNNSYSNGNNYTFVNYLFATLAGVSKVGSYTGTGADLNVDCGFSAGARFILIKRTDSTGDWYVWDSVRGIVAGNDPYLLLNSTAAEVTSTDYIDPLASGFTVTSSAPAALNASGGSYLFLAIA